MLSRSALSDVTEVAHGFSKCASPGSWSVSACVMKVCSVLGLKLVECGKAHDGMLRSRKEQHSGMDNLDPNFRPHTVRTLRIADALLKPQQEVAVLPLNSQKGLKTAWPSCQTSFIGASTTRQLFACLDAEAKLRRKYCRHKCAFFLAYLSESAVTDQRDACLCCQGVCVGACFLFFHCIFSSVMISFHFIEKKKCR